MMKKIIALVLSCGMLLGGCNQKDTTLQIPSNTLETSVSSEIIKVEESIEESDASQYELVNDVNYGGEIDFKGLDDKNLHQYVENTLYDNLVANIDSEKYFIENIEVTYISQEYIDELAYNSQANIYFGYTLEEITEIFEGEQYVFTLGEDGETIVVPFEEYNNPYEQVIKNVAMGSGVILICVTVSLVSAGTGAPAISTIFAASAKSATTFAISSAGLSGVTEGIITGAETGDMDKAIEAAALAGSEGFKWGAITGAVTGGASKLYEVSKANKVGNISKVTSNLDKLPKDYFDDIVDSTGGVNKQKINDLGMKIKKGEFNSDEIGEISRKMSKLGVTKEYEAEMKNIDFGSYLRNIKEEPPTNMVAPHAHHILFKTGNGKGQQELVEEGQALLRKYGIDPIVGPENLTWAPNKAGQHDVDRLQHVVNKLKEVDDFGGTKEKMTAMLRQLGEEAATLK